MKVLWLGAGASLDADYPTTYKLFDALDNCVSSGADIQTKEAWNRFQEYRAAACGVERTILHSPNPEVVLTLPDLYAAALAADDEDIEQSIVRSMMQKYKRGETTDSEIENASATAQDRYSALDRVPLDNARQARRYFLHVLDFFFMRMHHRDSETAHARKRDYLRKELAWLEDGDVVITTNWDTTVERTLTEDGRWTPADGYGFPVTLIEGHRATVFREENPLPERVPRMSRVRVLKLHGSYGWRKLDRYGPRVAEQQGSVFLDYHSFLSCMPFVSEGQPPTVACDVHAIHRYDPVAEPVFIVPSYLKQLEGASMQRVWYEAAQALAAAKHLRVVGASLPRADTAIRALLNPVRFRLENRLIDVEVCLPKDPEVYERWTSFLGPGVKPVDRKAGQDVA